MNIRNHPCFNDEARHLYARIHLPVAPRCNIQCNFCTRKFDCINESKPGVTSRILSPGEALDYIDRAMKIRGNISVVGIAGPGDPFANPDETLETLRLVRNKYDKTILCVATNGLNIMPYIEEITKLEVSHVTITINAVDAAIGAKIYSWVRDNKKILRKEEASDLLILRQLEAIGRLKSKGITVKINSIIIPGINDKNIIDVAIRVKELGADIINCMPMIPSEGSAFENIIAPEKASVDNIRTEVSKIMPQMHHCARCRADASGLIGEEMSDNDFELLRSVSNTRYSRGDRKNIAVGTREGIFINMHLGEIDYVYIYSIDDGKARLMEKRKVPDSGTGDARWHEFVRTIGDCFLILVSGAGENPERIFPEGGIKILRTEGFIDIVIERLIAGKKIIEKTDKNCGKASGCTGTGLGCG